MFNLLLLTLLRSGQVRTYMADAFPFCQVPRRLLQAGLVKTASGDAYGSSRCCVKAQHPRVAGNQPRLEKTCLEETCTNGWVHLHSKHTRIHVDIAQGTYSSVHVLVSARLVPSDLGSVEIAAEKSAPLHAQSPH